MTGSTYASSGVIYAKRHEDMPPKGNFHAVPVPALPPTPPGSAGHSPPRTTFLIPEPQGANYAHGSPSFNYYVSEAGASRRHLYESPQTPAAQQFDRTHYPFTTGREVGADSGYGMDSYGWRDDVSPYRAREYASRPFEPTGWEGTLSSTLASLIASFRAVLSSDNYLDTSSHPFAPLLRTARGTIKNLSTLSVSSVRFGLLCALWYTMSALSSNTGKVILNRFRYPVTLTIVQFGFVAGWCALFIAVREGLVGRRFSGVGRSAGGFWGIKRPSRTAMEGTMIMSAFQIAGHVFSSMAIARVPVSTVHTIKALSPMFTVMAYAGLFGVRYGTQTYISLVPLTLGVMLACSFDLRANGVGFLCALGSTIIFVSQNIFGKKMLPKENEHTKAGTTPGSAKMDKLTLLFYSSGMAFLLMIPIWMYSDGGSLLNAWLDGSGPSGSSGSGITALAFYFLCNGSVHFAQCLLAFAILARTSPVTYSIASLVKRIAVICLAIVWFGQKVSLLQAFGMAMTFSGLWMYNRAKSDVDKGERKRVQVEKRADLLLPSNAADARALDGYVSDQSRSNSPIAMPMPMYGPAGGAASLQHDAHVAPPPMGASVAASSPMPFGSLPGDGSASGAQARGAHGVAKHRTPSLSLGPAQTSALIR